MILTTLAQLKLPASSTTNYIVDPPRSSTFNLTTASLGQIISALLPYVFVFAGLLMFLLLVIGGFQYLVAAGDKKGADAARSLMTSAVVGFVIIFSAFWVIKILETVLGLTIF